jgi:arsenate reductase (thioredoxin)
MSKEQIQKVLFICTHNSGRSQMAEAFFNHAAGGKATAVSAGTQPAEMINPGVAAAMREIGIDISKNKPKLLTIDMVNGADRAIVMGCGAEASCPAALVPSENWELEDPEGQPLQKIRLIRDEIRRRVKELLKEIKQS